VEIIFRVILTILLPIITVSVGVIVALPIIAILACFDEVPYFSALWKRIKDTAKFFRDLGGTIGGSLGN